MSDVTLPCPKCGDPMPSNDKFCESCGTVLQEPPPSYTPTVTALDPTQCRCGAAADNRDADGFCLACGRKFEPRDPRDHGEEVYEPDFAAVSDKGIRHKRNEDAFAIALIPEGAVLVVSDGVSSASNSNLASAAAAAAARDELVKELPLDVDLKEVMGKAILKAHKSTLDIPMGEDGRPEPPGATILAAVVKNGRITLGWAGDSRGYWLGETESRQLTTDHSWMEQVVAAGQMTAEEALKDSRAHAITQCIGPLNEGPPEASFAEFEITEPGRLLLCSDGLWGYEGDPETLRAMVGDASPLDAARHFIQFAIEKGGVDNVTAVILHIKPQ